MHFSKKNNKILDKFQWASKTLNIHFEDRIMALFNFKIIKKGVFNISSKYLF